MMASGAPGTTVWAPTAQEMEAIDRRAVESGATSERVLIEAAGREVAARVAAHYPDGPVLGLVGSGHNGADAVVALRTLRARGRDVRAVLGGGRPPDPDPRAGWPVAYESPSDLERSPPAGGVLLDGLLGTGSRGAPRPPMAELIERAAGFGLPTVSVDVPSGIDASTGAVPGACVQADLTVSLGWPKLGLFRYPARSRAGDIEAVEIGFPPIDVPPVARVITDAWAAALLRGRAPDDHKGDSGYLLLVAGTKGMAGASVLAARAAYRSGAGIVRVLGHPGNRDIVQRAVPGAVFDELGDDPGARRAGVEWSHALVLGPGLGRSAELRARLVEILEARGDRPAVLDADALNAFEGDSAALASLLGPNDVITPHPGEFRRLFETDPIEEPVRSVREAAERLGCSVLLKGSPTWLADVEGSVRVAVRGGARFAVGGTGDVLAGCIGGLMAGGLGGLDSATAALALTAAAAEAAAPDSVIGMQAEDIPPHLPAARQRLAEGTAGIGGSRPGESVFFRLPAEPVS